MEKKILGKKIGMTQIFSADGKMIPVTALQAEGCVVVQIKTDETDGYNAVQLGIGDIRERLVNKPTAGHYAKADVAPRRILREFTVEATDSYELGGAVTVDVFEVGDKVDVSAVSKGKGYQGVIKRYGKRRGPEAHGSGYHRGVGSLGAGTSPGRIPKNKKMPGQTGRERVTVQNLEVVKVDAERGVILVKGSVPGAKGCLVEVKKSVKA